MMESTPFKVQIPSEIGFIWPILIQIYGSQFGNRRKWFYFCFSLNKVHGPRVTGGIRLMFLLSEHLSCNQSKLILIKVNWWLCWHSYLHCDDQIFSRVHWLNIFRVWWGKHNFVTTLINWLIFDTEHPLIECFSHGDELNNYQKLWLH